MYHSQFIHSNGDVDNAFFTCEREARRWCVMKINRFLKMDREDHLGYHQETDEERKMNYLPLFVETEYQIMSQLMSQDKYDDLIEFFNSHGPVTDEQESQIESEREKFGAKLNPPGYNNPNGFCMDYVSYGKIHPLKSAEDYIHPHY